MAIVGAIYQTILNRLIFKSCQLCNVAHDFRYDPRMCRPTYVDYPYVTYLRILQSFLPLKNIFSEAIVRFSFGVFVSPLNEVPSCRFYVYNSLKYVFNFDQRLRYTSQETKCIKWYSVLIFKKFTPIFPVTNLTYNLTFL